MSSKAEKYLEEAQIAMNKRNYSKAIKYFEDYMSLVPDDKKVLYSLADAYVFDGNIQVAIKLYLQVAEHLRTKGFIMKSVAVCKRVLNLDNSNYFAKDLMHRLYQDKSSEEESSKIFTQSYQSISEAPKEPPKSEKSQPEFLPVFAADMKQTSTSEISISGLQAVSGEAASEKLTGSVTFKETVAMPRVKEMASEIPKQNEEKLELPDSLTGGFVAVTPEDLYLDFEKPSDESVERSAEKEEENIPTPKVHSISSSPASKRTQTQEIRILKAKDLLFGELTELEYLKLIDLMEIRTFQPGEIVVREGTPGDSMFIICNGDVSVVTKDKSGKDVQLADLGEGDFFGEVSLLTGRPRTATIYAISYTEVLELKRVSLPEIEDNFPKIREKLEDFYHRRTMHTIETLIGQ